MAPRKVNLMSSDGVTFEVDDIVALELQTIKHMIEDGFSDGAIPLPNVTSGILAMVIEYCKMHVESSKSEDRSADDNLKAWDAEFVKVDVATLFHLIMVRFFPSFLFFRFLIIFISIALVILAWT